VQYTGSLGADIVNTGVMNGAVVLGNGANTLDSHAGTITGVVVLGSSSNTVTLGQGADAVSYANAASGVHVSLALGGQAQSTGVGIDTLTNVHNLTGSTFSDYLAGDAGNNVIDGGGGGNDVLDGGSGLNTVSFASASQGVTVSLALQGQAQNTGVGADTLSNFQILVGSTHADTLEGGGSAASTLTGGGGADTFAFRAADGAVTVTDFSAAAGDVIDLTSVSGVYDLAHVLADAKQVGADTVITIGSGSLRLLGVAEASLTAADFHLALPPNTVIGNVANNFTVTLTGGSQQYTLGPGGATVVGGPGNTEDSLSGVKRIQFVDGYETYSTTDPAATVYRLYEATLNRGPDPEGLASWVNALNGGSSLQGVASGFVSSAEFQKDYGALSNSDFVNLLYENVLHRGPTRQASATGWAR
jgi:hypothetical protein